MIDTFFKFVGYAMLWLLKVVNCLVVSKECVKIKYLCGVVMLLVLVMIVLMSLVVVEFVYILCVNFLMVSNE